MQEILQELNQHAGIIGSLVVTQDGMVVAQALRQDMDPDRIAAIASGVILSTTKALTPLGGEDLSRYVLTATAGRMMFIDIGIAFLVVVTNQSVNLANTLVEIDSAVYKITHRRTD